MQLCVCDCDRVLNNHEKVISSDEQATPNELALKLELQAFFVKIGKSGVKFDVLWRRKVLVGQKWT